MSALSVAGPSIGVLLAISAVTSALAIGAIYLDSSIRRRTGWSQTLLFPAIWTTLWAATSHSPLGRLTAWSPMSGTDSYRWMAPFVGMVGIDWVVASWSVVISRAIGAWFMGTPEGDDLDAESKRPSSLASTWSLFGILTILTLPSYIVFSGPHPHYPTESATPFHVGCALPALSRYNVTALGLEEYINASLRLDNPKLVLWPEGAVSFRNEKEKTAAFEKIAFEINSAGTYWAVSFEENFHNITDDKRIRRTGLAILSNSSSTPHLEYYKRSLVPVAESFRLSPGIDPPTLFTLQLGPPAWMKKATQRSSWGRTRPIDITASICLDFTMPSLFSALETRPGLILAPANTWDRAIGNRMWEEVKQRANELGTVALWCDGGKGGVSGVAGAGYNEVFQTGEGAWSRFIGLPFPFDSSPTFYGRFGALPAIVAVWLLLTGSSGFPLLVAGYRPKFPMEILARARNWVQARRGTAERNLIDL
ncbi:hypothetical protein C8F01DRAFT_975742 [Mycena amicta]|nr:hypothetical protein C8F01DRAFT_975742 [Mycena amicta]